MYKNILVCLDNSDQSNWGADIGLSIGKKYDSVLTGYHVYAAALHKSRFTQMESTLPPKYQKAEELNRQRDIHGTLISKGLQIIAESYTKAFELKCNEAGVACSGKATEGKNYLEITKELQTGAYDLAILGLQGLGVAGSSRIGSVCERVARRARTDILVVKENRPVDGRIVVAVDGSLNSYAGVRLAVGLGKAFGAGVEAISVYDSGFHYTAFRSLAGILSKEASRLFKFKEQEMLHEEIIDHGLAKIYQGYLDTAKDIAEKDGLTIKTTLIDGKPFDRILKHIETANPSLLIMGRAGMHAVKELDIGSNTENCLRQSKCNILITSRDYASTEGQTGLFR